MLGFWSRCLVRRKHRRSTGPPVGQIRQPRRLVAQPARTLPTNKYDLGYFAELGMRPSAVGANAVQPLLDQPGNLKEKN